MPVKLKSLLVYLMAASLPFHVTALIQSSDAGVQPYYVFASVFIFLAVMRSLGSGRIFLGDNETTRTGVMLLGLFTLISVIGAAILPTIFEGSPVYLPRGGIDDQYLDYGSLSFSISNIAGIVYLLIDWFVALSFLQMAQTKRIGNLMGTAIAIGGFIGCSSILIDAASSFLGFSESPFLIFKNNELRSDTLQKIIEVGSGAIRADGLFSESSISGGFSAVMTAFYLTRSRLCSDRREMWRHLALTMMAILGTVLSLSSTGFIGVALAVVIVMFVSPVLVERKRVGLIIKSPIFISCCLIALGVYSLLSTSSLFQSVFAQLITNKADDLSYVHRIAADQFSIDLLKNTYGLGVGVGSNRPNSFLVSLLSCTGVLGTFIFAALIYQIFKIIRFSKQPGQYGTDPAEQVVGVAIFNALLTDILLSCISLPDLTTPLMWILIAGALAIKKSTTALSPAPFSEAASASSIPEY